MKFKKLLANVSVALLVSAGAVLGLQSPTLAAGGYVNGPNNGQWGYGWYAVDEAANQLSVSVYPSNLAAGYCLTTYLDISRNPGPSGSETEGSHYDIRAARSCQSNVMRASGLQHEGSTYGIDITGVNKLSVCYGPLNQMGTCRHIIGSLSGVDPSFNSTKECSRAWTRAANGDTFYFHGYDPTECDG
jgi:hypothetical protein